MPRVKLRAKVEANARLRSPGALMLAAHVRKCWQCRFVLMKREPAFDLMCPAGQLLIVAALRSRAKRAPVTIMDENTTAPLVPKSYTASRMEYRAIGRSVLNHIFGKFGHSQGGFMGSIPIPLEVQRRRAPKFYVASSFKNLGHVQSIIAVLRGAGWEVTYDWTLAGGPALQHKRVEISLAEVEAVRNADVVIMLVPGGRGAHIELGVAIGLGKPIVLVFRNEKDLRGHDGFTCAFYEHPGIRRVSNKLWWDKPKKGRVGGWATFPFKVFGIAGA